MPSTVAESVSGGVAARRTNKFCGDRAGDDSMRDPGGREREEGEETHSLEPWREKEMESEEDAPSACFTWAGSNCRGRGGRLACGRDNY